MQLLNEKLNPGGQATGQLACCGGKKLKHGFFIRGSSGEMKNCDWFRTVFVVVVVLLFVVFKGGALRFGRPCHMLSMAREMAS